MDNERNPVIKIGFTFTNRYGNEYSATSNVEVLESIGISELTVIGEQFNAFLQQIGYPRKGRCVLAEDLTENELDAVYSFLQDFRDNNKEES